MCTDAQAIATLLFEKLTVSAAIATVQGKADPNEVAIEYYLLTGQTPQEVVDSVLSDYEAQIIKQRQRMSN